MNNGIQDFSVFRGMMLPHGGPHKTVLHPIVLEKLSEVSDLSVDELRENASNGTFVQALHDAGVSRDVFSQIRLSALEEAVQSGTLSEEEAKLLSGSSKFPDRPIRMMPHPLKPRGMMKLMSFLIEELGLENEEELINYISDPTSMTDLVDRKGLFGDSADSLFEILT